MKLKEVPHKFAQIECQRAKTKRTWLPHSFCRFRSSVDISSCGKKATNQRVALCLLTNSSRFLHLRFYLYNVRGAMRINKRIIPYELQLRKCIRNEKVSNKARMKRGQMRRHCMDRFYCY